MIITEEFLLFSTTCIACAGSLGKRSACTHTDMRTETTHGHPLRRMVAMQWRIGEIHADVRKYNYSRSLVNPFHTYIGRTYLVWTPRPDYVSPLLSKRTFEKNCFFVPPVDWKIYSSYYFSANYWGRKFLYLCRKDNSTLGDTTVTVGLFIMNR